PFFGGFYDTISEADDVRHRFCIACREGHFGLLVVGIAAFATDDAFGHGCDLNLGGMWTLRKFGIYSIAQCRSSRNNYIEGVRLMKFLRRTVLVAAAALLLAGDAPAATHVIEPDDFAEGTVLNDVHPLVQ